MAGAFTPINIKPGLVTDLSPWDASGYWIESDHIRFYKGRPEKLNGYTQYSNSTYNGTPRDLWTWTALSGSQYISIGTETQLYVATGGALYDITPITVSISANGIFSTSITSPLVLVSVSTHGAVSGDYVEFLNFLTVGGVFLSGAYPIVSVPSVDSFIVSSPSSATATSATSGGSNINVYIPSGNADTAAGFGWGTGTWGTGTWGTARTSGGVLIEGRQWSFDTYGENLLANLEHSYIYQWSPSTTVTQHAAAVTGAPSVVDSILVSDDRHVFALGTHDTAGTYDPLLGRWCSQEDINDWTASATNTAGDKRFDSGNYLVGGVRTKNSNLIFTDAALYSANYVGPPFVFNIQLLGTGCGLIAKHAAIDVNGTVYWMGKDNFYSYNGRINTLPCPVWKYVHDGMTESQQDKVFAGQIPTYNEVLWLYPDKNSNEPNLYVKYNWADQVWDLGTFDFSTWRFQSTFANAIAAGTSGPLMYMEVSTTPDANGAAFPAYVKSAPMQVASGNNLVLIDAMIPDMTVSGTANVTFDVYKYPNATTVTKGPYLVSAGTTRLGVRARGRLASIRIGASATGDKWRHNNLHLRMSPDGEQ